MSDTSTKQHRFNALIDAWLPVITEAGETVWCSPVDVLTGAKDGIELDYPRDDFRVFGRLLLSALAQALFAPKDKAELQRRLDVPLEAEVVRERLAPVLKDFDLFGPEPFLQIQAKAGAKEKGAAPFVFSTDDIALPPVQVHAVSIPIALVTLFIEQAYAGGAGRGYGAGPGGQPGAMTLIDPGSIRRGIWANVLSRAESDKIYGREAARPWSNEVRSGTPRAATGLVTGLFFQPRGVWLTPDGTGRCSFTGVMGPLVRISKLLSKSSLPKAAGEDLWQHPCAPLAVNSTQSIAAVRLRPGSPAWTGLAQLLHPISKGKKTHPREGVAPVLKQWTSLSGRTKRPDLLVLDFDRDKAIVRSRFFEKFPLGNAILTQPDVHERLRDLTNDAQDVGALLPRALKMAHDDRSPAFALADATSEYWTITEPHFLRWLDVVGSVEEWTATTEQQADLARAEMSRAMRTTVLKLFDQHVALSEFDPRKQERIANSRRWLQRKLFPRARTQGSTKQEDAVE